MYSYLINSKFGFSGFGWPVSPAGQQNQQELTPL
jgi:hypothetical protein